MSVEKESLEKLVERIDELLVVLSRISEDLRSMSESIKSVVGSQVTKSEPHTKTNPSKMSE
jgi:hypothetical protein